jgi:hypothetical protein
VVAELLTGERSAVPWDDIYAMVTPGLAFNMFFNTLPAFFGTRNPADPHVRVLTARAASRGAREAVS